jgi:hypothetical protein
MMTHQELTEAYLEEANEPTSAKMTSVAVHEEVCEEDGTVKPVGALEKAAQGLASSCRKLNKWTQGNGWSWKKLAAASRGTDRHARVTQHNGHGRGNGAPRNQKRLKYKKGCWKDPECNNGIRN